MQSTARRQLLKCGLSNFRPRRLYQGQHQMSSKRFMSLPKLPRLENIENLDQYCGPGGFHPVTIGNVFAQRYEVLHKLGYGGSSTVWLARDRGLAELPHFGGAMVTLKILSAELSSQVEIPDLFIPQALDSLNENSKLPGRENLPVVLDKFSHIGPNGTHLCLITPFAGPSIRSIYDSPELVSGSRRLRNCLARKVAYQIANAVHLLHSAGVIHGDITLSNVLFQLSDVPRKWSKDEVYQILGEPKTNVIAIPVEKAPLRVVQRIEVTRLFQTSFLKEDVLLIDFGQSILAHRIPPDYKLATPMEYLAPEAFFDSKISVASDVWALACAIYEIRAGHPLFEDFFNDHDVVFKAMVETLGKFPDPWWSSWENRGKWFNEKGGIKMIEEQQSVLPAEITPLFERIRGIGLRDDPLGTNKGSMIEQTGTRIEAAEATLLEDLLGKMLRYIPQDRLSMSEVVQHPWFKYDRAEDVV